jgi:hypothetical protein
MLWFRTCSAVCGWWLNVQNPLFLKLQVTGVTLYTACFNTEECSFSYTYTWFVSCDSDKQHLFSLNSMKWLGLIVKTPCPFCEVEIEFLYFICMRYCTCFRGLRSDIILCTTGTMCNPCMFIHSYCSFSICWWACIRWMSPVFRSNINRKRI